MHRRLDRFPFDCPRTTETSDDDDDDDESIKDEEVRHDIPILSARLYDLKERFMKIVHKINCDAANFNGRLSDEGKHRDRAIGEISSFLHLLRWIRGHERC